LQLAYWLTCDRTNIHWDPVCN